ncbi:serine O-acetyltransferase [Furfurilactobacillus entadae]|uniref:serine O-acetyltransferase n=1 Tax=Furfurilactobacillus entadae TaxID=2922307 RepID=UPI0035EE1209
MFETVDSIIQRDPAARSRWQVILTYAGYQAVVGHRMTNWLWRHDHLLLAEVLSHWIRHHTGVEIHPAATLGRRLFIDHGMGVVIGETAVVGDDVTILHGVTLGSRHDEAGRRHPTIRNHVLLGANAQLLGPITIHDYAKVGAGAIVLHDVGNGETVAGNPAKLVNSWAKRSLKDNDKQLTNQENVKDGNEHD